MPSSAAVYGAKVISTQRPLLAATLAAGVVACAPTSSPTPVFTCTSLPFRCQGFELEKTSIDLVKPSEPMCPMLGKFRDRLDFQFCRCEYEQYTTELFDRAACIGERRAQLATAAYNEAARVYNCRLLEHECTPLNRVRFGTLTLMVDYSNRPPDLPSCVTFLTQRPFHHRFEANNCRAEIDQLKDDLLRWAKREGETALFEARTEADRAVDRFNCYASGGKFCL